MLSPFRTIKGAVVANKLPSKFEFLELQELTRTLVAAHLKVNVAPEAIDAFVHGLQAECKKGELSKFADYYFAVDDALMVRGIGVASGNAKRDLDRILNWECDVALDPAVSEAAAALVAKDAPWLPMDSAPKDGTPIWAFNGEQGVMKWIEGGTPGEDGHYALWVWQDQVLSDVDPEPDQPTAWRALPAPPQLKPEEGEFMNTQQPTKKLTAGVTVWMGDRSITREIPLEDVMTQDRLALEFADANAILRAEKWKESKSGS